MTDYDKGYQAGVAFAARVCRTVQKRLEGESDEAGRWSNENAREFDHQSYGAAECAKTLEDCLPNTPTTPPSEYGDNLDDPEAGVFEREPKPGEGVEESGEPDETK